MHASAIGLLILFALIVLFRLGLPSYRKWKREAGMVRADREEAEFDAKLADERKAGTR